MLPHAQGLDFKSSGQDLAGEKSFTLRVHHPVSTMETQMAPHLVTVSLMVMSPYLFMLLGMWA